MLGKDWKLPVDWKASYGTPSSSSSLPVGVCAFGKTMLSDGLVAVGELIEGAWIIFLNCGLLMVLCVRGVSGSLVLLAVDEPSMSSVGSRPPLCR